jgi:hypothetical protein
MALSPAQIQLLQIAAGTGGAKFSREQYHTMLKNVAGVDSSRDPAFTNEAFERCMALCEQHGFEDRCHGAGYWQGKFEDRAGRASHQQVHKLRELADQTRYPLAPMSRKFSGNRTDTPSELTPREAWNLIEAYKKIIARDGETGKADVSPDAGSTPARTRAPRRRQPGLFGDDSNADRTAPPGLPDIPTARPPKARSAEDVRQQRAQYCDDPGAADIPTTEDDVPF